MTRRKNCSPQRTTANVFLKLTAQNLAKNLTKDNPLRMYSRPRSGLRSAGRITRVEMGFEARPNKHNRISAHRRNPIISCGYIPAPCLPLARQAFSCLLETPYTIVCSYSYYESNLALKISFLFCINKCNPFDNYIFLAILLCLKKQIRKS